MPVQLAKVRVDSTGRGTVELDGQEIPGVRSVTVRTEVNCRPILVIEVLAREVDLKQSDPDQGEEVAG
ncbi:hypothetical protein [Streptomyces sp. DSM 40750]|uniref:hypothetical protein n=1 Tax=Streptomyces sp. DSM 40750 TaxID=2801030 RepID=UPI00214BA791|nr:hypothetical protein [Streptomyces sp. DSM 40750]UUU21709.1 hypothetical protein JIX55_16005 [Streptomyces sp. DSM 40750]